MRDGYGTPDVRLERKQTYTVNGKPDWIGTLEADLKRLHQRCIERYCSRPQA